MSSSEVSTGQDPRGGHKRLGLSTLGETVRTGAEGGMIGCCGGVRLGEGLVVSGGVFIWASHGRAVWALGE